MISYNPFNASGILIRTRISEVTWLRRTYNRRKIKEKKLVIKIDFYVHHCEIFRVIRIKKEKSFFFCWCCDIFIFFLLLSRDQKRDLYFSFRFSSIYLVYYCIIFEW